MTLVAFVSTTLSILTLLSTMYLVLFVLGFVLRKKFPKLLEVLLNIVKHHEIQWSFVIALVATAGSLFYSEIAGYTPCKLCWFQRIFMYPLVIILGAALVKRRNPKIYVIPMTSIGALIASYHYLIQRFEYATSCGVNAVECTMKYSFKFGYITIPMMALCAFLLITILLWQKKH